MEGAYYLFCCILVGCILIKILAKNKQELEKELRERVKAFFIANNETPESVSIKMDFNESGQNLESPTIQIHVKDSV